MPNDEAASSGTFDAVRDRIDAFAAEEGRRPRVLVVRLADDGDDEGAWAMASGLADAGFDVDIGPPAQSPDNASRSAVENDVHVVAVASLGRSHAAGVIELLRGLAEADARHVLVACRGPIPEDDGETLINAGAVAVLRPDDPLAAAAEGIVDILCADRGI